MKKVMYITDYVDIGGGESSLINMLHYFKDRGLLDPLLVVPREGELTKICEDLNIRYIVLPFDFLKVAWVKFIPVINPMATLRLILILKREKIDLIHVNSSSHALTNSLIPSFLLKIDMIWTCHGWWEKPYGLRAKLLNLFVSKVFAVSNYVKQFTEFPEGKVITTYLGIDFRKFTRDPKKKALIEGDQNKVVIGMIGRYQPVKNQLLFVEAAEEILNHKEFSNCSFLLVGDVNFSAKYNEYKSRVHDKIKRSIYKDKIKTHGFEKNIQKIYDAIDILVVPSEFESFSMATVEAMAMGLKVVATDKGGPKEIIEDGISGYLFSSCDKDDLIANIKRAIKSNDKVNEEAINRAKEFSVENIGISMFEQYEKTWEK